MLEGALRLPNRSGPRAPPPSALEQIMLEDWDPMEKCLSLSCIELVFFFLLAILELGASVDASF
jgi:hypothetical protein